MIYIYIYIYSFIYLFCFLECLVVLFNRSMFLLWDIDLRKPGVRKPPKRPEFEVPTEEVLKSAELKVSIYGFVHSLLYDE